MLRFACLIIVYPNRLRLTGRFGSRSRNAIPYLSPLKFAALKGEEYEACEVNREFKCLRVGLTPVSVRAGFRRTSRWKTLHGPLRRHLQN